MEQITYCDASLTDRKCDAVQSEKECCMNDCPRLISESQRYNGCCSELSATLGETPCQGTGYTNCCSSFSDCPSQSILQSTCSSGCSSFPTSEVQSSLCKTPPRCFAPPRSTKENIRGHIVCDGNVCRLVPDSISDSIPILTLTPAMKNESQSSLPSAHVSSSKLPLNRMCSIPPRFTRYRHPSHKHRMFMLRGLERVCDNSNCKHDIEEDETVFTCFKCDFDLCQTCFQLDSETVVPLSKDDENIHDKTVEPL
jgi:hypothetical protein